MVSGSKCPLLTSTLDMMSLDWGSLAYLSYRNFEILCPVMRVRVWIAPHKYWQCTEKLHQPLLRDHQSYSPCGHVWMSRSRVWACMLRGKTPLTAHTHASTHSLQNCVRYAQIKIFAAHKHPTDTLLPTSIPTAMKYIRYILCSLRGADFTHFHGTGTSAVVCFVCVVPRIDRASWARTGALDQI